MMTTMNEFPPRVLESLNSMDAFDDFSPYFQSHEFLVDGAVDKFNLETYVDTFGDITNFEFEAVKLSNSTTTNEFPPRVLESLDSMDAFDKSFSNFQSHDFLVDWDVDNFNLETYVDTFHDKMQNTLENTLGDYKENFEFEGVKLSNSTTSDHFEEFVYPKGDPDAVCLSKRDVDLLQPATYINDNIIDFYILYLKNKIQEQEKARFHFFNSFFFRKLAGKDKNAPYVYDGKSAFQSVRKWTRKVNLFEKDYIFIPVNFNRHWSLIVICHPGDVVNSNDTEPEKSLRLPCILHMDSIKGYHSGLKDIVQSYLCDEWKERNKDTCGEDLSSRFLNMPFLSAEVPQQENAYDCGLFLLHHLELFLAEAPVNFDPFRITKFSNFLNLNWFPPAEASLKRTFIRRLIFELVENEGSHEGFSSDNGDDCLCSEYNDNRIGGQSHLINGEALTSNDIEIIEVKKNSRSYPMSIENIRNMKHFWEDRPAKKRRLMHLPGGSDGILTSFIFV